MTPVASLRAAAQVTKGVPSCDRGTITQLFMGPNFSVMEKADNLVAVAYRPKWSDLDGWDVVWSEVDKDENRNAVSDAAHSIECVNSLLRSENSSQQLVGLGSEKIIAVSMPDAVLVAHKDRATGRSSSYGKH